MPYRVIDLFCGPDGMTLGFADSRYCCKFAPVLAVDKRRVRRGQQPASGVAVA